METPLPMCFLRLVAALRARSMIDSIALASIPVAAMLIGATVVIS